MTQQRGELPFKSIAGVVPVATGWLLVTARMKGATFVPDIPRIFTELTDIVHRRPAFSVIAIDAPIGAQELGLAGERSADREADALLGYPAHATRWQGRDPALLPGSSTTSTTFPGGYLTERYAALLEEVPPYLQRTVCESLAELVFFQLNGERPLMLRPWTDEGYEERRTLMVKVPGITRILDAEIDGADRRQLLEAASLLWAGRRVTARAGKRVPTQPEWDERGMRSEMLR